ncbi:FkbM family methyltransferase [Salinisphaera sp. Q1T1-3]|uniref:FkbM family methyltransferase n=1 Tax=Salinisphaera sp. Q1T1-3 TaxID=2321229 RepID=UPI001314C9D6|nr:FkbM family methyltransferase [Salinisphaera sp. Q1T1-3]
MDGYPVQSAYGVQLVSNFSDFTNRAAILGLYGSALTRHLRNLPAGSVFMDIGANCGLYSLIAAGSVGPTGRVLSFEPQLELFSQLVENINRNGFRNITPFNLALSDQSSGIRLNGSTRHSGATFISYDLSSEIWAANLASDLKLASKIVGERELNIKVDVEGAELLALKSLGSLLGRSQTRSAIVEIDQKYLARFGVAPHEIDEHMQQAGFANQTPQPKTRETNEHYDAFYVKPPLEDG